MKTNLAHRLFTIAGFVLGFYLILIVLQPIVFANRFGAFSQISGVNVGFMTAEVAKERVGAAYAEYSASKVSVGGQVITAGDLLHGIDADKTINDALLTEQSGYLGFSKFTGQKHRMNLVYNEGAISKLLLKAYDKLAIAPADASIQINKKTTITPGKNGQRLLLAESRENIWNGLARLDGIIEYKVVTQTPGMTSAEAESMVANAEANLSEPITLLGDGVSYTISVTDLHSWLKISSSRPKSLVAIEPFLPQVADYYFLDRSKVSAYIDRLAKSIDTTAVNAKLTATGGQVVVATKETIGHQLDRNDSATQIQGAVTGNRIVVLKISTVKPEIRADNLTELGLTTLVSTGWTDFSGSPVNRIHNVQTGASKFNGVLIKPAENFSFNKALGPVDASTGYLPELVILADKTVPEYGGGLCQVSSTAFRAALNAGLPILERHAHAYPVGYYKPYGVDATIYLPTPDLRFANDTGKYILIQTRIEGKKLYFDFYGTKKPVTIMFSGNDKAIGAVATVEKVSPTISDQGVRGNNSFTAVFYRHIYNLAGVMTDNDKFTSKYESPDKYPH